MRILIVEDEILVADYIKNVIQSKTSHIVIDICEDYNSTIELCNNQSIDICLLDIRIEGEKNGIEIAKKLKSIGIPFIFITANNDSKTIQNAAITEPLSFLSKPFNEHDLIAALEIAKNKLPKTLKFFNKREKTEIVMDEILYIKSENVYVEIVTVKSKIILRMKLKDISCLLPENEFSQCHRSYIINNNKIEKKLHNKIIINDFEIPFSRSFKSNFD